MALALPQKATLFALERCENLGRYRDGAHSTRVFIDGDYTQRIAAGGGMDVLVEWDALAQSSGKLFYRLAQQAVEVDSVPLDQIPHPDDREEKPQPVAFT